MVSHAQDYQREARAGLQLLAKRLEKISTDGGNIGHASIQQTAAADAESVKAVLDAGKPLPEPEGARGQERVILRSGLRLLAHNLKAASGTVTALGRLELADEFREEAEYIEQQVLPRLEEQVPLRLEPAAANG